MQNTHYEMLYREESGHWWYKVRRKIIHNLIKQYRLNFGKEIKILDVGCGTGLLLKELEALGVCYGIVRRLIEEHLSSKMDNKKILWNLIVFQNWHSRFCMGNET